VLPLLRSRRDQISAIITAPFALWAAVRATGVGLGFPLLGVIALTPIVALFSPVAVVVALVLRTRLTAAVAAVAAGVLAASVLPRGAEGPQVASADTPGTALVVMTTNLWRGEADAGAILRLAREHRVDVLSVQELTTEAVARLDAAGVRDLFPARVLEPRTGGAGGGLLARHALRPVSTAAVEGHEQPEVTLTLPGGRDVRIQSVHPISPVSGDRVAEWRRQLGSLGEPHARDGTPRVLAGDFNATLDHRELRRLLARGFYDAADAAGQGLHTTWPAAGPVVGLLTLDHVLLPPEIKVRSVTLHDIGSDHRAVIAELVLSPS
jgi:endonuclease/exonuclease/phosphatase (EEP) superfamily protein YafD